MPQFLAKEGRGVDYLVLWLDCDKEGENICFEVIDCVQPVMKRRPGQVSSQTTISRRSLDGSCSVVKYLLWTFVFYISEFSFE